MGERRARSSWTLLYLLIDPTTAPTNHGAGTVFYVGWLQDSSRSTGSIRAMLDLNAAEALPESVPTEVRSRVESLWSVGVAPLVRVLSFGGPGQTENLDGPRMAWLWSAACLRPPPLNVPADLPAPPSLAKDPESQLVFWRRNVAREWTVEDYVSVRDPRLVVLPREVPTLVAGMDLRHDTWAALGMIGVEMAEMPRRRWWDVSIRHHPQNLWRWVQTLEVDPLLVLVVKDRPSGELCPTGLVVGVWSGQVRLDSDDSSVLRVDAHPLDAGDVALRRRLLRGQLFEEDGRPFSLPYSSLRAVPQPVTGA